MTKNKHNGIITPSMNLKKWNFIKIAIAVNVLFVIVVIIIMIVINKAHSATMQIQVAPEAATITLNNAEYENLKTHDIIPGDYHVKISMENMTTKEFDVSIKEGDFLKISEYLLGADNSFDYYLSHSSDVILLENIADIDDQKAQDFIKLYKKKASLADHLPLYFDEYTDDFAYYIQYNISQDPREDCPKVLCLIIEDNTGDNEERAKEKIRELEYNLEDYEIIYQYVPLYGAEANE